MRWLVLLLALSMLSAACQSVPTATPTISNATDGSNPAATSPPPRSSVVANVDSPTYRCAGAEFQFPLRGNIGWLYHDPRSQWYDPTTGTLPDTDNAARVTGKPIVHTGVDFFVLGQSASDLAVYPLADGEVAAIVSTKSFNIWYPKEKVYSYFAHVSHKLNKGDQVKANESIGQVVDGHIHFSISDSLATDLNPDRTLDPSGLFQARLADPTKDVWRDKYGDMGDYVDSEGWYGPKGQHYPRLKAPQGSPANPTNWTSRESTFCSGNTPAPQQPAVPAAQATIAAQQTQIAVQQQQIGAMQAAQAQPKAPAPATSPTDVGRLFTKSLLAGDINGARARMSQAAQSAYSSNLAAFASELSACGQSAMEVSSSGLWVMIQFTPLCGDIRTAWGLLRKDFPADAIPPGPIKRYGVEVQLVNEEWKVTSIDVSWF